MAYHLDRVAVLVSSTGTSRSAVTTTTAINTAMFTAAEAGAVNGRTYTYVMTQGGDVEEGTAVNTSSGTTWALTITKSKVGGTAGTTPIDLDGSAVFRLVESAAEQDYAASALSATLDTDGTLAANSDTTVASQKATKTYVDTKAANLAKKFVSVRAATTANITISTALNNADTLDGVTLATGDLVLVKDQSAPETNGIYVVGVSPARDTMFDTYNEHPGALVTVEEGTTNADSLWLCTSDNGGTLNTTAINFKYSPPVNAATFPVVMHAASSKTTPVDADELALVDSAASNGLKKLTWANLKATLKTYLDGLYSPITRTVNFQTGTTYTLVLGDAGNIVSCSNASAITLTIPPNSSVAFPRSSTTATQIDVIQAGAGKVTIAAGAGVTINNTNKSVSAQYAGVSLLLVGADTWTIVGATIA